MKIRNVEKKDYKSIYNLVKNAFETAYVSDGGEQDFVNKLRESEKYIKDLELVLENNNEIIGHIMLTKQKIYTKEGIINELLLGPVCTKLEYRNKGLGKKLIKEDLKIAKKLNFNGVFLVGNPEFYSQLGFKKSSDFNIKHVNDFPEDFALALELKENSLEDIEGTIDFEERL